MQPQYFCYTDGSSKKDPDAPGGWGVYVKTPQGDEAEKSGFAIKTSPRLMELTAIQECLMLLPTHAVARVFTDSRSALHTCTNELVQWRRQGWQSCKEPEVALLRSIDQLLVEKQLTIEWTWLRAHNGNKGNERAHALAASGAREAKRQLKAAKEQP